MATATAAATAATTAAATAAATTRELLLPVSFPLSPSAAAGRAPLSIMAAGVSTAENRNQRLDQNHSDGTRTGTGPGLTSVCDGQVDGAADLGAWPRPLQVTLVGPGVQEAGVPQDERGVSAHHGGVPQHDSAVEEAVLVALKATLVPVEVNVAAGDQVRPAPLQDRDVSHAATAHQHDVLQHAHFLLGDAHFLLAWTHKHQNGLEFSDRMPTGNHEKTFWLHVKS